SRFGFSYYYPSYGSGGFPSSIYSSAYNDPWWSSSFGYYGGGYSPYGNSYYNPYSYGYYSPYSSYYYSSLYYRYGYTYGTPVRHRVRDFGSTRGRTSDGTTVNGSGGSGATIDYGRGTSNGGGGTLAPAYNNSGGGGVRGTSSSDVGARPRQGSQRVGTSQGSSVQKGARSNRGAGSRGGGNRGTRRDTQHGYVPNEGGKQSAPPSSQTPTRETGRQPEQSRGREASAPRSAPPPSSGQSSESRSSGSSRGRRP
ncbi:MAG TPA: hypothetical protein VGR15_00185, partial [Bacteroidota bacterium]|nr:hypothetical protein [Bacteroidota bacterium]